MEVDRRELTFSATALTLLIGLLLVFLFFFSDDSPIDKLAEGPFGLSPRLATGIVLVVILIPVPYLLWHVLLVSTYARREATKGFTRPGLRSYVKFLRRRSPDNATIRRSKTIALLAVAYLLLVVVGWIIAAAAMGI